MKLKSILAASVASATLMLASCDSPKGWTVEGTVAGGEGQKIALQGFNNSNWYTIDSIAVGNNGKFKYTSATPAAYPEVLRLSLGSSSIYFPVDSVSEITVSADASSFGRGYRLSGTESAQRFVEIDSLISSVIAAKGENAAATDSLLKRQLTQIVLADKQQIASYYIINKRVAGKPLFDPANRRDLAIIGAVAQNFASNRPDDPRTLSLRNLFLSAKIAANPDLVQQDSTAVEIPESGLAGDIKSYDNRGVSHSLYDTAAKGNVVLLSFTRYDLETSPAYNVVLADLYKKYRDRGFEIFQVAFDEDEAEWKQSAVNLPWITVWNSPEDGSASLINYNVNVLPLTYIIDRKGDLRSRITDPTTLDHELAKYL